MTESAPGRTCEDKESREEQKVDVAIEGVRMCLESRASGRLSSQITDSCVFCHIKFDARPVCDWSCPLPLSTTDAQTSDVVHIKAGPPPSQGAINREREASGTQCNEIKPNQPQLPVFYWASVQSFQFLLCISICIRNILSIGCLCVLDRLVHGGTLCISMWVCENVCEKAARVKDNVKYLCESVCNILVLHPAGHVTSSKDVFILMVKGLSV